jgi:ABC-type bacteriocin/lantibiotic exporter with double-glycine peptidase domain
MTSSVLFAAAVLGLAVLAIFFSPIALVPLAVIVVSALIAVPIWRRAKGTAIAQKDAAPSGTASTQQASYDPTRGGGPGH